MQRLREYLTTSYGGRMDKSDDADLGCASLRGASLDQAQLQGASLVGAQLQGASLEYAQLQGALWSSLSKIP
jgi:uncharacterized protein YjbI with pentapeptide repeats